MSILKLAGCLLLIDVGLDGKGGDDWSKADYIHNVLGFDLNTTDLVNDLLPDAAPFWAHM
jgi:hypothetical protein